MMKNILPITYGFTLTALFSLLSTAAIEVREPENEGIEGAVAQLLTNSKEPEDIGVAVGEAPDVESSVTSEEPYIGGIHSISATATSPIIDAIFPENHKNFSASTYLGAIESPPFLDAYNKYQEQYKAYYAQKENYASTKPVKFEQTTYNNHYVGGGLGSYGDSPTGSDVRLRNKPFPYFYNGAQNIAEGVQESSQLTESANLNTKHENDIAGSTLGESGETQSAIGYSGFPQIPAFGNFFAKQKDHDASELNHDHKTDQGLLQSGGGWKKVVRLLSTVIPLGLFLATLTPNILYVNSTEDSRPSRLRSLEGTGNGEEDPLVDLVKKYGGLEAMDDPACEDRFFCEMSVMGRNNQGNFVEKGFWYLANETPDDMAQEVGMKELFKAIRSDSCHIFDCKPIASSRVEKKSLPAPEKEPPKKPKKVKKFIRS